MVVSAAPAPAGDATEPSHEERGMADTGQWRKSPPDLVDRFHEAVAGIDGLDVRKMFGYPAGFIGGNMTTGLHQESFLVRLPEDARAECLADGWSIFEPMPGRPMREYVTLPPEVVADVKATRRWVERAAAYVRTLPAKVPKPPKKQG
jgi:TfoX/Sxy family transcriptional regulator of competence genes